MATSLFNKKPLFPYSSTTPGAAAQQSPISNLFPSSPVVSAGLTPEIYLNKTNPQASARVGYSPTTMATGQALNPNGGFSVGEGNSMEQTAAAGDTSGAASGTGTGIDINAVKSTIQGTIDQINQNFQMLFTSIEQALGGQRGQLQSGYDRTVNALTQQVAEEGDAVSGQYAARGLGDSSYRAGGLGKLQRGYDQLMGDEQRSLQGGLAELGQYGATTTTGYQEDQEAVNRNLSMLDQFDEAGLLQLRNDLDTKLSQLQTAQTGFNTEQGFVGKLNQIAPATDTLPAAQARLKLLASEYGTSDFKMQIAENIISRSGLLPEQQDALRQDFYAMMGIPAKEETVFA